MTRAYNPGGSLNLIVTLWALLLSKCFLLEYLVRHYAVPINTLTYVWTLSILMASVATVVYARLHKNEVRALAQGAGTAVRLPAIMLAAVFILWSLSSSPESDGLTLALAALTIAISHTLIYFQKPKGSQIWKLIAWFFMAILLAISSLPTGYLLFAAGIFCLSFLPGLFRSIKSFRHRSDY